MRSGTSITPLVTLAALMNAAAAFASPPQVPVLDPVPEAASKSAQDTVLEVLPSLDSSLVFDRLDAHDAARRAVGGRLAPVEAVLARPDLSPEQVERLTSVAYNIFASRPRAAMGVRFGLMQGAEDGVMIDGAVPGFDAARVILPGDVLRSIGGEPVLEQADARRLIISYDPGEELAVELLRDGQVRDARIRLGSYRELEPQSRSNLSQSTLRTAWEARLSRIRPSSPPLHSGLADEREAVLRSGESSLKGMRLLNPDAGAVTAAVADGPLMTPAGSMRGPLLSYNRPFRTRQVKDSIFYSLSNHVEQDDARAEQNRLVSARLHDASLPIADRRRNEVYYRSNILELVKQSELRRQEWRRHRSQVEDTAQPQ